MSMIIGTVGWMELHTDNQGSSSQFYSSLLGLNPTNENGDVFLHNPRAQENIAGVVESDYGNCWVPYFVVGDMDGTTLQAYQKGATMLNQGTLPEAKWAVLKDPQGAIFALWQPI